MTKQVNYLNFILVFVCNIKNLLLKNYQKIILRKVLKTTSYFKYYLDFFLIILFLIHSERMKTDKGDYFVLKSKFLKNKKKRESCKN